MLACFDVMRDRRLRTGAPRRDNDGWVDGERRGAAIGVEQRGAAQGALLMVRHPSDGAESESGYWVTALFAGSTYLGGYRERRGTEAALTIHRP